MSYASVGRPHYKELVREFFDHHGNQWYTIREVAEQLDITPSGARSSCRALHRDGLLVCSRDPEWVALAKTQGFDHKRSTIGLTFRSKRGYLPRSTFRAREFPDVIFFGEDPLIGPFCVHCGNPDWIHGPNGECLNYRIHPLLPPGDLPAAKDAT